MFTKSGRLGGRFGNVINNTLTPPATKLSQKRLSGWIEGMSDSHERRTIPVRLSIWAFATDSTKSNLLSIICIIYTADFVSFHDPRDEQNICIVFCFCVGDERSLGLCLTIKYIPRDHLIAYTAAFKRALPAQTGKIQNAHGK